ncbi:hypothetical protein PHYSODRAFT_261444 [Phytophthora sojae]|uniref:Uncharacterized protein n=1 Tax=Phytophthora sojae (strain P6497) TaxID=1094619 RepID=G4ZDM9_PHYSP|nr:hypothetical protein PHYSODRAFT_261444 [Phytophthora sojae]EGZ18368.1 hypothetical protein PHYSODRAFT_261444 [Phytophthora sojae]|eukprot:XP_009527426.1 hypothetical protein PHYSODRAFT_261444 [Phytophthora sojae]
MYSVALLLAVSSALSARTLATDYAGGWLNGSVSTGQCVDICSAPSATCLTKDPACLAKQKVPGDFDYLVLEQLFVPQFCRDLLRAASKLTIHGLWPNYDDGYVSCCNPSDSVANDPYDVVKFAESQATLLAEMGDKWIDASQKSTYDTLCEIYDHEFQKHGLCYAAQGADLEAAAVTYFKATLSTADRLSAATEQINAWAALDTPQSTLAEIQALYDHQVMVFCSAVNGENQLSVIRTCYEKPSDIGSEGPTTQIDCANATATSTFSVCSGDEPITLLLYVAPGSTSSSTSVAASTSASASSASQATTSAPTSEPTVSPKACA